MTTPIDPPEPDHDPNFLSTRPTDAVWQSASVTEPGTGAALGYIKSRSTGAIWHVGPNNGGTGSVKWLGSTTLNTGGGGLLMTQDDANKVMAATSISGGQLVTPSGSYTGKQQHYNATNPLAPTTPLYTNLVIYKLV